MSATPSMVENDKNAAAIAKATGTQFGDDVAGAIMKKYDTNGDGVFDVAEVRQIVNDIMAQKGQNKQLKRFVGILFILMIAMCVAMFGTSLIAGMALKDSKVQGSTMMALDGNAMQVDSCESNTGLFDLPAVDTATLAKLKDLVFYVDLTALAGAGAWAEATFKVAGVWKINNDLATIEMTSGASVTIRRAAKTGELLMNGASYPVSDKCTGTCSVQGSSRRLRTDNAVTEPVEFTGPRGRKLGFFSGLQTSGSFTMMQAGGF